MRTISEIWAATAATPTDRGLLVTRIDANTKCDLFAGLSFPDQRPVLVLEVGSSVVPKGTVTIRSRGLHFYLERLPKNGRLRLNLILEDAALRDIFAVLAQDIADHVSSSANEIDGCAAFLNRLKLWQMLLERLRPEGLTPSEQLGLYGELWFLRHLVLEKVRTVDAIAGWTGPAGKNQDFEYGGKGWEVKSTAANDPTKVQISNIEQLNPGPLGSLVLVHLAVREQRTVGQSLPSLVEDIRRTIDTDKHALELFTDLLLDGGYLTLQADAYAEPLYTVREVRFFLVQGAFPRLMPGSLADGVIDVKYSILLQACSPHEMTAEIAASFLSEALG